MDASETFMMNLAKPERRAEISETLHRLKFKVYEMLIRPNPPIKKIKAEPKQKKKLSRREIKELGIYTIPHDTIRYKDAQLLHRMWRGYISWFLNTDQIPDVTSFQYNTLVASLLKADYHGAKLTIARSKQSSVVGMKGIVILDTKGTFKIVSKDNKVRTIPKDDSMFDVHLDDTVISIFGKYLSSRPAERSVRKMKVFSLPDL